MYVSLSSLPKGTIVYPDSDGKPMAENTKQARWIVVFYGNLCALFRDTADVFVAVDNLWYPEEGNLNLSIAPDVYVVFGRPKGDRSSYKQWEEENVPLTVVFEVLSPGNSYQEMADKLEFYDTHGVEEYYVCDPGHNTLDVYLRKGEVLRRVRPADGFVSPRLGVRFRLTEPEITVYRPDGRRFLTFEEMETERIQAEQRAEQAEERAGQAEQARQQAEERAARAEAEVERLRRQLGQAGGPGAQA